MIAKTPNEVSLITLRKYRMSDHRERTPPPLTIRPWTSYSYSQSKGLFATASLGSAAMASDDKANGEDIDAAQMVRYGQRPYLPARRS